MHNNNKTATHNCGICDLTSIPGPYFNDEILLLKERTVLCMCMFMCMYTSMNLSRVDRRGHVNPWCESHIWYEASAYVMENKLWHLNEILER